MEDRRRAFWVSLKLLPVLALGAAVMALVLLSGGERADAANGETTLRAGNSGKCLAVYPGEQRNGAIAYQWTCGDGNNIRIEDAGGGWHYIKFVHSGKCLTVNGFAWWDGAVLDQWDCVGQANQKWSGNFVGNVFEVHYSQANPTKCITVHAESRINGAWVNQWQCVYQSNQAWIMEDREATPTPTPTRTATVTPTPTSTPKPGDGELTINKICVPTTDTGEFSIRVSGVIQGTVGCGEHVGPISLAAGTYTISESAGPGTDLADYERSFGGDCNASGQVVIEADEDATCTITNERE
jgi:hypothetical protein